MLETYLINIDKDLDKESFDVLLNYVSEDRKKQIHRFFRFEDSQRSLLGNVLSRYALCKRLNLKNKDLLFNKNEYGKPSLINSNGIHFNVSHSSNWVACAVNNKAVGIDVEVMNKVGMDIAKRFFSADEYSALLRQPEALQQTYFYKLWTLKESYIKAEGKGMSIPLDSFSINVENNTITIVSEDRVIENSIFHTALDNRSFLAICTANLEKDYKKVVFTTEHFFKEAVEAL